MTSAHRVHRLAVHVRGIDPRGLALVESARHIGLGNVQKILVYDLLFIRGNIADHCSTIETIISDPLLQIVHWNGPACSSVQVVETVLLPGVTDSVANELLRVASKLGLTIDAVASGRRFEIHGELSSGDLNLLTRKLLANPVIEQWSIDATIEPNFVSDSATVMGNVELIYLTAQTTDAELLSIGKNRALALDLEELRAVRDHYVRQGTPARDIELEAIAQTWSEHCSHKTFRACITTTTGEVLVPLINQLRHTTERINAPFVISAFVGNAGIVSFESGTTYAVKAETHNHPSAIEPFGGANTGIGGVIRDVLGASHKPIACTNILCFGPADLSIADVPEGVFHPRQIRSGVIAGIADYGNKIGLPTVAGAVLYDPGYIANPLVFAGCIGIAHNEYFADVALPGDRVVVLGGPTGRDGLRGATFSSMTMDATTGDVAGASVQIGDPIIEKLLIDVLGTQRHLYRAITDCGAGGLSCAIGEMAQGVGARVELSSLPLKYAGLAPWELWLSEAQERMVVSVAQTRPLFEACAAAGVHCVDIGEFTGDGRLVVTYHGDMVLDMDTEFLHDGRPQREMTAHMPTPDRTLMSDAEFARVFGKIDLRETLLALLSHPNIASKESVIRRYDHEIGNSTLVRPLVGASNDGHADGVVMAHPLQTTGIALGIGVNPWIGLVDPQRMAMCVVDEAIRNVVAVGADPNKIALLDNFSWGDPQRASTLGDLAAAVGGCCAAAEAFGAPFVSGKDSLNNEYLGSDNQRHAVPPTLVITAIGHVPNVDRVITPDVKTPGNILVLLGRTICEMGGSHLAKVLGISGGAAPTFDESAPHRYQQLHRAIINSELVSCHDVCEGGIAVTVAEMSMAGRLGIELTLSTVPPWWFFSESCGRFVIEVRPEKLQEIIGRFGADAQVIGHVRATPKVVLNEDVTIDIDSLRAAWQVTQ